MFNIYKNKIRPALIQAETLPYNNWLIIILLFLICFSGYSNSLNNGFLIDDNVVLFGEKGIANKTFFSLFSAKQDIFYRPIGHVFLFFCYKIFPQDPLYYHCANLALFTLICFLFYKITFELSKNTNLALLTSVLYALHPINNFLVNYVTANIISTFLIFTQLSFLFAIKGFDIDKNKPSCILLSLFFFILALLSHEMSIILPIYILFMIYFTKNKPILKSLKFIIPYLFLIAIYLLIKVKFFQFSKNINVVFFIFKNHPGAILPEFVPSILNLIYWYLSKLLIPYNFIFLLTKDIVRTPSISVLIQLSIIFIILYYFIFIRWKKGFKAFALATFSFGFLPCIFASYTHYPNTKPMIEPHWFYFSSYGLFLIVASWLLEFRKQANKFGTFSILLILISYLSLLLISNIKWRDQETYCKYWISIDPSHMTPWYCIGTSKMEQGLYEEAILYFEKSLELGDFPTGFITNKLGYISFLLGDSLKAEQFYFLSFKHEHYAETHYYMGLLLLQRGNYWAAKQAFDKAMEMSPKNKKFKTIDLSDYYPKLRNTSTD